MSGTRGRALGGRYLLSFDGDHYWAVNLTTDARTNLTAGLGTVFSNQEYDVPTDRRPPYGVGGWLEEDEAVLLCHEHASVRGEPDRRGLVESREDHVVLEPGRQGLRLRLTTEECQRGDQDRRKNGIPRIRP